MTKLIPIDHDTHLIYKCPDCDIQHWRSLYEVMSGQPMLVCHCGFTGEIERLTQPRFVAKYADKVDKESSNLVTTIDTPDMIKASSIIKAQGFSVDETRLYLNRVIQKHGAQPVTELVRLAIAEATHNESQAECV